MTDKPRIVLIDLSSLFWTAYMVNAENGVREPRAVTLANVQRCAQPGDLIAVCCDSGKSFRKDLDPNYKANRDKQPPAAYGELEKTKERLRADGYLLWGVEGFEADDVIATAAKAANDRGHEVRVCSSDKDLFQLVNVRSDILRTHTWEVWDSRKITEKLGIDSAQVGDWLALTGDSSDNIPGVEGIGKGRAAQLLTQYETLDRLYAAVDAGQDVPHMAKLRAGKDSAMLSRKLVALRFDVPIDFETIYSERKVTPLTQSEPLPSDGDPSDEKEDVAPAKEPESSQISSPLSDSATHTQSVALVPVVEYERQLEPRSLRAAVWLGQHLFDSRLYSKFTTAEAITAVIIRGRELGLGATTALDVFHVIDGKPVPYAWFIISLATESKVCEYLELVDANEKSATWKTKRRGNTQEQTCTYTYEQAEKALLPRMGARGPNAWLKGPEDMLVKTAGVKLARRVYPAQTLGLYAIEELGGDEQ